MERKRLNIYIWKWREFLWPHLVQPTRNGNRAIGGTILSIPARTVFDMPTADLSIKEPRTRSRIQSPPLRLPCETLIYILLFTIDNTLVGSLRVPGRRLVYSCIAMHRQSYENR